MTRVRRSLRGGAVLLLALAACGSEGPDASTAPAAAQRSRADAASDAIGRPSAVPPDFVPTPHGWFHPSCVVEVRGGERIRGDDIERADGSRRPLARCGHPSYDPHGAVRRPEPTPPPYVDQGWIEAAETRAGAIEWLSATWTVPLDPTVAGTQTVYLFPGIVPLATNDTILQPVLGWNAQADRRWTIASWNCCRNGNALHSPLVPVPAGADVTGVVAGSGCAVATGVCTAWQIETAATSGAVTTLDTDSYGEALDRTFAGALEVYALGDCRQLPASGSVSFRDLGVHLVGGAAISPAWLSDVWPVTPACSYGVVQDPVLAAVQLRWCAPATCAGRCGVVTDSCGGTLRCPACAATGGCKKGTRCCKPGVSQCALCVSSKQPCPP